ncbi:MAG: winged helix-turn-helix transcriptional regulator [Candidatus Bipolaricaulota bacterium]|nr:MAG: winged helix-turn-helix transcriptional regulator [Candidatus Bipolaricaulota bacterium]
MQHHEAVEIFKALSVPSRVRILTLLKVKGPLPVKRIAEELGMTSPAISQHLKILRHAGLVYSQRQGFAVPYGVDPQGLNDGCGMMIRVCACPGCHDETDGEPPKDERSRLLHRREALLTELQRIEQTLEGMRSE